MKRSSSATASGLTRVAQALFAISLALLAYHFFVPSSPGHPYSNAALGGSTALWSVATLFYGVHRPHFKLSVVTAAAFLLRALGYIFPSLVAAPWKRGVLDLLVVVFGIAWLRWVVWSRRANRRSP